MSFLYGNADHQDLHSFPTRRSSDLPDTAFGSGARAQGQRAWPANRSSPYRIMLWLRSEEHTSELQSQSNLVCRLLLEKKKPYSRSHSLDALTITHSNYRRYLSQSPY